MAFLPICEICYDNLTEVKNESFILTCGHSFHSRCIAKWIYMKESAGEQPKCPMCRQMVTHGVMLDANPPVSEDNMFQYSLSLVSVIRKVNQGLAKDIGRYREKARIIANLGLRDIRIQLKYLEQKKALRKQLSQLENEIHREEMILRSRKSGTQQNLAKRQLFSSEKDQDFF